MARFDNFDIAQELVELCRDIQSDIFQQLNYYRASVYKSETAAIIDHKLSQLKLVVELLGCEETLDHFLDFEASRGNGNIALAPGECLLTWRITDLFKSLEHAYISLSDSKASFRNPDFAFNIQKNRRKLAALCPQGSRKRSFFETL
ncbi:hypothetical protein [Pseudobacteriovorax antillogorgiicola]|uniref:Uncharacterized protein n=1 Tax=Pseudobacteriovorax antillogorgiicola TaxID=1513793 RepID=A0A1Y6BV16_9BACT|nr:hypothetical protein [Pseudobacteriovorax antillogorgiicola]TCS53838.1 hypothetical protein EDD56_107147 [Pseudobacteriovorax antillogorgiicola]SMF21688.1 hypothetical protein SAMN06296036_107125 [Pseudobacteriovorax antillogorgiicola]